MSSESKKSEMESDDSRLPSDTSLAMMGTSIGSAYETVMGTVQVLLCNLLSSVLPVDAVVHDVSGGAIMLCSAIANDECTDVLSALSRCALTGSTLVADFSVLVDNCATSSVSTVLLCVM